ncbi:hypothetical protein ENBRE01_0625 [Enteropsectra breve]|nr:hypothetical protein ENBRE01_0625 [Enteropsectra breve]
MVVINKNTPKRLKEKYLDVIKHLHGMFIATKMVEKQKNARGMEEIKAKKDIKNDAKPDNNSMRLSTDAKRHKSSDADTLVLEKLNEEMEKRILEMKEEESIAKKQEEETILALQLEIDSLKSKLKVEGIVEKLNSKTEKEKPMGLDLLAVHSNLGKAEKEIKALKDELLKQHKEKYDQSLTIKTLNEKVFFMEKINRDVENRNKMKDIPQPEGASEADVVLIEEISSISKSFDTIMETNRMLEQKVSSLNQRVESAKSENAGLVNKLRMVEGEKYSIEKDKKKNEQTSHDLEKLREELELQRNELGKKEYECEEKLKNYREKMARMGESVILLEKEIEGSKGLLGARTESLERLEQQYEANKIRLDNSLSKINILKEIYAIDKEAEKKIESIDVYKKALRCKICSHNTKDAAITKCGHCFCKSCLDARIKKRIRFCPTCNEEFCSTDILKLYLYKSENEK